MPRSFIPLWLAAVSLVHSAPPVQPEADSTLVRAWLEGTPLLSAKVHQYFVLHFPQSCCLAPPPRMLTLDARTGKVRFETRFSATHDPDSVRTRFQPLHRKGDLRGLLPAKDLEALSPRSSPTVRFRFSVDFLRFGASQGGIFETRPSPRDTFRLPGHCCDPGGSDTTPCRAPANQWTLWVDPATRQGVLQSGYQTQADACDVVDRFHAVSWAPSAHDSLERLSGAEKVFEHGHAGWHLETHRIHVASRPNLGGGYPEQQYLVIDARSGGILGASPTPWRAPEESDVAADSVAKSRRDVEGSLLRSKVVPVRPWESVRRVSSGSGVVLEGIRSGACMRIRQTRPQRIQVSPSCCDPTAEQPTKPCRLPANDWVFWPAPRGRSGLLRAQVTGLSNDCNGGPVYSIESWNPATCSDEDFLDP